MHSVAAIFAGLAAIAYAQNPGEQWGKNAIYHPLTGETVKVGVPYSIEWSPDAVESTYTILLLKGCPSNCLPVYNIAEGIANSGKFSWTPAADLEEDPSSYGLKLIADTTGNFQYSGNFGVENDVVVPPSDDEEEPTSVPDPEPTDDAEESEDEYCSDEETGGWGNSTVPLPTGGNGPGPTDEPDFSDSAAIFGGSSFVAAVIALGAGALFVF